MCLSNLLKTGNVITASVRIMSTEVHAMDSVRQPARELNDTYCFAHFPSLYSPLRSLRATVSDFQSDSYYTTLTLFELV